MTEHEKRLKRLSMRSWRRGIKEMDLILGRFWDAEGPRLTADELDLYEDLLTRNDQELFSWCNGQSEPMPEFVQLIARIMKSAPQRAPQT